MAPLPPNLPDYESPFSNYPENAIPGGQRSAMEAPVSPLSRGSGNKGCSFSSNLWLQKNNCLLTWLFGLLWSAQASFMLEKPRLVVKSEVSWSCSVCWCDGMGSGLMQSRWAALSPCLASGTGAKAICVLLGGNRERGFDCKGVHSILMDAWPEVF